MDKIEIINSLKKYEKEEFKCKFLSDTIDYFHKIRNPITKLEDNEYLLAGIKIHLMYNNYYVYLLSELEYDNKTYREINLSQKAANNLINQIDGINNGNFKICNELKSENIRFYLLISETKLKGHKVVNEDIYNPLLGIHSLFFLEHQNLNTYCSEKYLNESTELYKELHRIYKLIKKLNIIQKERMLFFSGLTYHFLGTVHTRDIDIFYVSNNIDESNKLIDKFNLKDTLTELHILYRDDLSDILKLEESKNLADNIEWKQNFYKNIYPYWGGAENIYESLINPKYHFYFMGLKCIDIYSNFKKALSRSQPFQVVDALMLLRNNGLKYYKEYCVKNISIRQGNAVITNDKNDMIQFKKAVIKYLKLWYNVGIQESQLDKFLVKCHEKDGTIYKPTDIPWQYKDKLSIQQIIIHRNISQRLIKLYSKKGDSLLDIGCGKLTGLEIYEEIKLKNVYGVEPSLESINKANERIEKVKKRGSKIHYEIIQGYGDKPIDFNKEFEIITFIFTIHYMYDNLDEVFKNINRLSKPGTIIIITLINGNKLINQLRKDNKVEVRQDGKEIYWGVYKYNDNLKMDKFKALFYMKDVYGVENGSEEWVVEPRNIINSFKKNNYKLIYNESFLKEYEDYFNNKTIEDFQKEILNYQEILVFKKL